MKSLFSLITAILLVSFAYIEDIYSIRINTLDGNTIDLSDYRGKKILFVVAPMAADDSTLSVKELSALQAKYANSLVVIGIMAEESGFKKGDAGMVMNMYKEHGANVILTEGMKVKKSAGDKQNPLLQWLTNKGKNRHFDQDVQGVGNKFFVDESGDLYAVLGPQIKLSNPVIERVLARQLIKK